MVVEISTLFLYLSLVFVMAISAKTKSCHLGLAILVFSSTFIAGSEYNNTYIAVISWLALSALFSYLFYLEYERPLSKREENESVSDVIFGYLLGFFILVLLKSHGAGWILSLLASYWVFHLMLLIDHRENRRAFYLLKVPYVVLSWGALVEEFGFQRELIPFLIAYLVVFVLWLKFDLPRIWRPPRIT
ncbi:hypothetical protein [Thermococcus sp. AM4]|uniref:hypothetical protein n=1 Tax=Thermococcus sp. (strain AM4) TaxID=246969 RepID=UPI0001870DDC|nr:hypothetical protein [Thermococcus sp. AM4]